MESDKWSRIEGEVHCKEVIGTRMAVWKSGSCDWLARRANNLTSELQPQGVSSSFLHPPSPSYPPVLPAMASRRLAFNLNQALRSRAALKSIQPVKRGFASPVALPSTTQSTTLSNGFTVRPAIPFDSTAASLMTCRSPPITPHGRRPPRSACGSTPVAAQRLTRPTEPPTSSSTLPSRSVPIDHTSSNTSLTMICRAPTSARSTNWSSRLRTWALT